MRGPCRIVRLLFTPHRGVFMPHNGAQPLWFRARRKRKTERAAEAALSSKCPLPDYFSRSFTMPEALAKSIWPG